MTEGMSELSGGVFVLKSIGGGCPGLNGLLCPSVHYLSSYINIRFVCSYFCIYITKGGCFFCPRISRGEYAENSRVRLILAMSNTFWCIRITLFRIFSKYGRNTNALATLIILQTKGNPH